MVSVIDVEGILVVEMIPTALPAMPSTLDELSGK
jgi:hypothetical protein